MTKDNTLVLPDNVEARAFHVGFYIPNATIEARQFTDYYDEAIAGNLKPVESRITSDYFRGLFPEEFNQKSPKGTFNRVPGGALIGGYMLSADDEGTLYGPNGSIADTVAMVEKAIANSGMDHGYVMFYLFSDEPEWNSIYFLMSPEETSLRAVSMEEYLSQNQPWNA